MFILRFLASLYLGCEISGWTNPTVRKSVSSAKILKIKMQANSCEKPARGMKANGLLTGSVGQILFLSVYELTRTGA